MKQISYNIFSELTRSNNHVRGLAKALSTNPMTISRYLKELEKNNIVEFREEGKNKVYMIKDSLETGEFKKIVEHTKLMAVIQNNPRIRAIAKVQECYVKAMGAGGNDFIAWTGSFNCESGKS